MFKNRKYLIIIFLISLVLMWGWISRNSLSRVGLEPDTGSKLGADIFLKSESRVRTINKNRLYSLIEKSNLDKSIISSDAFLLDQSNLELNNHIEISQQGDIPPEFKQYVLSAMILGINRWDDLYKDKNFNLGSIIKEKGLRVIISDNQDTFRVLSNGPIGRAFSRICPSEVSDNNDCRPVIYVRFDPAAWNKNQFYYFISPQALLAHEVFHVGHFYLLAKNGLANLFIKQNPGMNWQKESFAVVSSRLIPYMNAYKEFSNLNEEITSRGYFSWQSRTDQKYELSYGLGPFVDQLSFRSNSGALLLSNWLHNTSFDSEPFWSLMATVDQDTGNKDEIDISNFQDLYIRAITDLYFPGLIDPQITLDIRTVGAINYDKIKTESGLKLVNKNNVDAMFNVDVIGNKLTFVPLSNFSEIDRATSLNISISSDNKKTEPNLRALVLAIKGANGNSLAQCYRQISSGNESTIRAQVKKCVSANAFILGAFGVQDKSPIKYRLSDLRNFQNNLDNLSLVVLTVNTINDTSLASDVIITPAHVKLSFSLESNNINILGGRFFPTIEGDSDYIGGLSQDCYIQSYPYEEKQNNYLTNVNLNIDKDNKTVSGAGSVSLPNGSSCKISLKGIITKDGKIISAAISGTSVHSINEPDQVKTFGNGYISTNFAGTIDLGKFREDNYVDKTKGIDRTTQNWDGTYRITYTDSKTDKSKIKGVNFSEGPKRGMKESGTFHLDILTKY